MMRREFTLGVIALFTILMCIAAAATVTRGEFDVLKHRMQRCEAEIVLLTKTVATLRAEFKRHTAAQITLKSGRIRILPAVAEICKQADVHFDWDRSHSNIRSRRMGPFPVHLEGATFIEALREVVRKNGLYYHYDRRKNILWLKQTLKEP